MEPVSYLLGAARRLARTIRHLPDRVLHPWRRERAIARLRALGAPESVLFICYGNICRSPYAAVVFRSLIPSSRRTTISVRDAGLYGHGRPSPERAIEVASSRGVDLTEHRSTLLSDEVVAGVELVVVMSPEQRRMISARYPWLRKGVVVLGDLDPLPIETRTIVDPYARAAEVFDASYTRIDRCLEGLAAVLFSDDLSPRTPGRVPVPTR